MTSDDDDWGYPPRRERHQHPAGERRRFVGTRNEEGVRARAGGSECHMLCRRCRGAGVLRVLLKRVGVGRRILRRPTARGHEVPYYLENVFRQSNQARQAPRLDDAWAGFHRQRRGQLHLAPEEQMFQAVE